MYDPKLGQWLSEDPIEFESGTENLREYVGNHPTYATDPDGLAEQAPFLPALGPVSGVVEPPPRQMVPISALPTHNCITGYPLARQVNDPPPSIAVPLPPPRRTQARSFSSYTRLMRAPNMFGD